MQPRHACKPWDRLGRRGRARPATPPSHAPTPPPPPPQLDLFNRSGLNSASAYALAQRRRRFAEFVDARPHLAAAELSIQIGAFCRHVREMPEAPAPPWLLRVVPPRASEMPQQAPELARRVGASLAAPAVVRFADAPPADMVAQLELVHVLELPESSRLTLFKAELDATSASVLLQAGGVYVAAVGELTAFCAQHGVGCVVKGVVSAPHSTLRLMVQEPRAADGLDREFRLPLVYAQAGERPGEVQLVYKDSEKGWPQVVLTHADGSTSTICVAVLLSAFEVLVLRRGAATTRIALPAHPIQMRSPLLTSAHEAYTFSRRQPAAVDRKRKYKHTHTGFCIGYNMSKIDNCE